MVTVWSPIPVPAAADTSFAAELLSVEEDRVMVAGVQVAPLSQATVGVLGTVKFVDASVSPLALVKVVAESVMFHPLPDPVASPTSTVSVAVLVVLVPPRVTLEKVTAGGELTNASVPATGVTVTVVPGAGALPL